MVQAGRRQGGPRHVPIYRRHRRDAVPVVNELYICNRAHHYLRKSFEKACPFRRCHRVHRIHIVAFVEDDAELTFHATTILRQKGAADLLPLERLQAVVSKSYEYPRVLLTH